MINKEQAKAYAKQANKIKYFDEVIEEINNKILEASLKGEYRIEYNINVRNNIIMEYQEKLKELFSKELGFKFICFSDSLIIDWRN